jgi:hypothetical protein
LVFSVAIQMRFLGPGLGTLHLALRVHSSSTSVFSVYVGDCFGLDRKRVQLEDTKLIVSIVLLARKMMIMIKRPVMMVML